VLKGDVNCDGTVTAADASLLLRYLVGLAEITPQGLINAEVTGDSSLTSADASLILRYIVGLAVFE
jgi:hypothetical protein